MGYAIWLYMHWTGCYSGSFQVHNVLLDFVFSSSQYTFRLYSSVPWSIVSQDFKRTADFVLSREAALVGVASVN